MVWLFLFPASTSGARARRSPTTDAAIRVDREGAARKPPLCVWRKRWPTPAPSLAPLRTGLACRCPRCGKGKLFQGFLNLRPRCEACGLDFDFAEAGDGPAVFIILDRGLRRGRGGADRRVQYGPPFWLHAVLWLPLIFATTLLPLRPMKGLMIALQYHHKAAEGQAGPQ